MGTPLFLVLLRPSPFSSRTALRLCPKMCGVLPRSLAEGYLYTGGKKVFQACVEDMEWPRKSGFCCLCHGGAVAEWWERVPLVQLGSPAGSEHHDATAGDIFVCDL